MGTFSKNHLLRGASGSIIQGTGELSLLSHQFPQAYTVFPPVVNFLTSYSATHGSLGYCNTHPCDKTRVYRFGNEIILSECELIDLINAVNHIWNRSLSQLGNGFYCSNLHFLINTGCCRIQSPTKYIWEAYHIINLIGIVGTARTHYHIRSSCRSIFVRYFWIRIG